MISKATAKFIKSLQLKKFRKQHQLFVVEGGKSVKEVLNSDYQVTMLLGSSDFLAANDGNSVAEVHETSATVLSSVGSFKTNDSALAVVKMLPNHELNIGKEFVLVLDDVNDPGNLGTIVRVADWYGINKIIASHTSAEFYNPKVIAASKGSFCRVSMFYTDLEDILNMELGPIYVSAMEGKNIHDMVFNAPGFIVMGNEAHGVSDKLLKRADHLITIPRYGNAESLNVAMATAIICDNVFRH